jgi:putative heme-binding domain-containing protein
MRTVLEGLKLGLADRDASVRFPSIVALGQVGPPASPILRSALPSEPDARNQAALAEALGGMGDAASVQVLTALVVDPARPEPVRAAALDGLTRFRGPDVLRARLAVLYDSQAPDTLVARALPTLARDGIVPPNDLAGFLESASPLVRAAALMSLNVKKALPAAIKDLVVARLDDPAQDVRQAAILAAGALKLREAVPRLIQVASQPDADLRTQAMAALCLMPDPRAAAIYLQAVQDPDPSLRRAGEGALQAIRDQVDLRVIRASTTTRNRPTSVEELRRFALAHPGDARKGEELFFENKTIACARCHSAAGHGTSTLGPDLTGLALKYDKVEIVRSVLHPSDRIAPGYQAVILATHDGKLLTGQVRSETDKLLELIDADLKATRIAKSEIRERRPANVSLMPAGLVQSLSPLEFTDLITYLETLNRPARD